MGRKKKRSLKGFIPTINGHKIKSHKELIKETAEDLGLDNQVVSDIITRYFDRAAEQVLYTGIWRVPGFLSSELRYQKIFKGCLSGVDTKGKRYVVPTIVLKWNINFSKLFNIVYAGRVVNNVKVTANNWRNASKLKKMFTIKVKENSIIPDSWIEID